MTGESWIWSNNSATVWGMNAHQRSYVEGLSSTTELYTDRAYGKWLDYGFHLIQELITSRSASYLAIGRYSNIGKRAWLEDLGHWAQLKEVDYWRGGLQKFMSGGGVGMGGVNFLFRTLQKERISVSTNLNTLHLGSQSPCPNFLQHFPTAAVLGMLSLLVSCPEQQHRPVFCAHLRGLHWVIFLCFSLEWFCS